MTDIDAIYYVYKNPYATYKSLESFRKFYPISNIYLISDNSYDYTEMAKHFNCIYFENTEKTNCTGKLQIYESSIAIHKFIEMWIKVFKLSDKKYIIKLEDDVVVQGVIDISILNCSINGPMKNPIPDIVFENYYYFEKNKPIIPKNILFSGHGGCLFNREDFLVYMGNKEIINKCLNVYISTGWFNGYIWDDAFFSFIAIISGFTIGDNPNHMEVDTDKNIKDKNKCTILHQVKDNYNIPMPDELKHLFRL